MYFVLDIPVQYYYYYKIMQGFTRLQKLGICMSRKSTNRKIKEAAQHFQKKVKSWKAVLERGTQTQKEPKVSCKSNFC